MRLTLLRAKEALKTRSPIDRLEYRINRASERLMLNGRFAGATHTLRLPILYGQMTLPLQYRTCEGIVVESEDRVLEIASTGYQFLPRHSQALATQCNMGILRDLGDGFATRYDMPFDGTLSTDYTGAQDFPVTIYGIDADGMPVVLVIADKSLTPANPFRHIDRIHKEQTSVAVYVNHTAADTTVTSMAILPPTFEEAYYRRYAIDYLVDQPTATALTLCKLRHIDAQSDQDVLPFTNISALEAMMDSLQYRSENDVNLADRYENDAVDILNKEIADMNAETGIPNMRFIYPGGTTPRFVSRY